jgi:hypothetical protein
MVLNFRPVMSAKMKLESAKRPNVKTKLGYATPNLCSEFGGQLGASPFKSDRGTDSLLSKSALSSCICAGHKKSKCELTLR